MPVIDMRADAPQLQIDDLPVLSDEDRVAAQTTWRGRMVNEYVSSRVFGVLVGQLIAAGVRPTRVAEAATAVADELRHARSCASVLRALGGEPVADLPTLPEVPAHPDAGPLETALRNLLSVCCLSETVAVSLISAEFFELEGSTIGDVLKGILADEVRHSRLGWNLVAELMPQVDSAMRTRLNDYLRVALTHLRDHELSHLPPLRSPSSAAEQVGVCDGLAARALFQDTVRDVILPALRERGLSGDAAWKALTSDFTDSVDSNRCAVA